MNVFLTTYICKKEIWQIFKEIMEIKIFKGPKKNLEKKLNSNLSTNLFLYLHVYLKMHILTGIY